MTNDTKPEPNADVVGYVARWGGDCRDCADENGVCPNSGLPCGGARKAIEHVIKALQYGVQHGYIANPLQAALTQARTVPVTDTQLEQLFSAAHYRGEYGRGFQEDARQILAAPSAVQAGWRLVPVEPTREMIEKGAHLLLNSTHQDEVAAGYRAMLGAAPSPADQPHQLTVAEQRTLGRALHNSVRFVDEADQPPPAEKP